MAETTRPHETNMKHILTAFTITALALSATPMLAHGGKGAAGKGPSIEQAPTGPGSMHGKGEPGERHEGKGKGKGKGKGSKGGKGGKGS